MNRDLYQRLSEAVKSLVFEVAQGDLSSIKTGGVIPPFSPKAVEAAEFIRSVMGESKFMINGKCYLLIWGPNDHENHTGWDLCESDDDNILDFDSEDN